MLFVCDKFCVIYFKYPTFDFSLAVSKSLTYFTSKGVFVLLTLLRLLLNHSAIVWFSAYKKPPAKASGLFIIYI